MVVSLPHFKSKSSSSTSESGKFRFKVMTMKDTFTFTKIRGPVMDRGDSEAKTYMHGFNYEQKAYDQSTGHLLHTESGSWMDVPVSRESDPAIQRMGTVPHGNAFLMQSTFIGKKKGAPIIEDVSVLPFSSDNTSSDDSSSSTTSAVGSSSTGTSGGVAAEETDYSDPITKAALPPGIKRKDVLNPNRLLRRAHKSLNIRSTRVINVSSLTAGGIVNSDYIKKNTNTTSVEGNFWLLRLKKEDGSKSWAIQYSQTVMLEFDGRKWPHVVCGTLFKKE